MNDDFLNKFDAVVCGGIKIRFHIHSSGLCFGSCVKQSVDIGNAKLGCQMTVVLEQTDIRCLQIVLHNKRMSYKQLWLESICVEKCFVLLEGMFHNPFEVELLDYDDCDVGLAKEFCEKCLEYRLEWYRSYRGLRVIRDAYVDKTEMMQIVGQYYNQFVQLFDDLGIVYSVFLIMTADNGIPIDIRCSYLIESCESLSEEMEVKFHLSELNILRDCILRVILHCGRGIFGDELSDVAKFDALLSSLVHTRNRVMHIKMKAQSDCLSGESALLCYYKLIHLYRLCVLSFVDNGFLKYEAKAMDAINSFIKMYQIEVT